VSPPDEKEGTSQDKAAGRPYEGSAGDPEACPEASEDQGPETGTGRSGEIKGVVVFPMKDGRATGERIYIDGLSFLIQLGILPEPKSLFGRLLFLLFRLRLALKALWRQKG